MRTFLVFISVVSITGMFLVWSRGEKTQEDFTVTESVQNDKTQVVEENKAGVDSSFPSITEGETEAPSTELTSTSSTGEAQDTKPLPSATTSVIYEVQKGAEAQSSTSRQAAKDAAFAMKNELEGLPSLEIARMILTGEISSDLVEVLDLDLDISDFVTLQKRWNTPLEQIGGSSKSTIDHYKGFGVQVGSHGDDVLDMYLYDADGRYTGPVKIFPDPDAYLAVAEQIPGTGLSSFGGRITYIIESDADAVTLFFKGKKMDIADIQMLTTSAEDIVSLSFPVSSSTQGSVEFTHKDDSFIVNKWNIDFNGDGATDVSIGNKTNFTNTDYRTAFNVIATDKKLSDDDRKNAVLWEKPFIESMNDM